MTAYLLDTNVISAAAPQRGATTDVDRNVSAWVSHAGADLYISWITVLELETGILKLGRKSPGNFHSRMEAWFQGIIATFDRNLLIVDAPVVRLAAKLTEDNDARGLKPGMADTLIAATALHHGLALLTRNLRHFQIEGLQVIDPFTTLPE